MTINRRVSDIATGMIRERHADIIKNQETVLLNILMKISKRVKFARVRMTRAFGKAEMKLSEKVEQLFLSRKRNQRRLQGTQKLKMASSRDIPNLIPDISYT